MKKIVLPSDPQRGLSGHSWSGAIRTHCSGGVPGRATASSSEGSTLFLPTRCTVKRIQRASGENVTHQIWAPAGDDRRMRCGCSALGFDVDHRDTDVGCDVGGVPASSDMNSPSTALLSGVQSPGTKVNLELHGVRNRSVPPKRR